MGLFRHTVDDNIIIDDGTELQMPLSFFVTQEAAYSLDPSYERREYNQSTYHAVYDSDNNETVVEETWPTGDTYISNRATYSAAYDSFLATPATLADAKELQIANMIAYGEGTREEYVTYNGNDHFSSRSVLTDLIGEFEKYTRVGALPVGYYVNDTAYGQVAVANLTGAASLAGIIDQIVELHHEVRKVEDTHRAAINALGTISAVMAYDYTTGWPTTPYV